MTKGKMYPVANMSPSPTDSRRKAPKDETRGKSQENANIAINLGPAG
jgi:hypothetical protein